MKRCVIIGAGALSPSAKELLTAEDYLIAADGGYRGCQLLGREPDLLLGDFDSLEGPLPQAKEILRYPVEKDDTDSMLALKVGLQRGFRRFLLLGMCGGRLDHSLANIQTVVYGTLHGAVVELADEGLWLSALLGGQSLTVPYREGHTLSVLAHSDKVRGVTLGGLQYPLEEAELENSFPLGVSNHFLPGQDATVSIGEGVALVLCCKEQ